MAGTGPGRATPLQVDVGPVQSSHQQPSRAPMRGTAGMFLAQDVSEGTGKCPFLGVHVFAAGGSSMYQHQHCNHSRLSRKRPFEIERIEEALDVDRGSSFLQIPWQGDTSGEGCRSSRSFGRWPDKARRRPASSSSAPTTVHWFSADPELAGLVVVPRRCVGSLPRIARPWTRACARRSPTRGAAGSRSERGFNQPNRGDAGPVCTNKPRVLPGSAPGGEAPTTDDFQASQPSPEPTFVREANHSSPTTAFR